MEVRKRLPERVASACCVGPVPPGLGQGIAEFNAGQYFAAHETLEALWMAEPGDRRLLYQGILQVGVGLYHLRRGNYRGALNLLEYGVDKLARLPERCLGVAVAALRADAVACREQVRALGPDGLAAFDWRLAPVVGFDQTAGDGQRPPTGQPEETAGGAPTPRPGTLPSGTPYNME